MARSNTRWPAWGDHPVIVGVLVITAVIGAIAGIASFPRKEQPFGYVGRVLDGKTQNPIVSAKITLDFQGKSPVAYTDSEGVYRFPISLDSDNVTGRIRVDAATYTTYERNITLSRNNQQTEDIRLFAGNESSASPVPIVTDTATEITSSPDPASESPGVSTTTDPENNTTSTQIQPSPTSSISMGNWSDIIRVDTDCGFQPVLVPSSIKLELKTTKELIDAIEQIRPMLNDKTLYTCEGSWTKVPMVREDGSKSVTMLLYVSSIISDATQIQIGKTMKVSVHTEKDIPERVTAMASSLGAVGQFRDFGSIPLNTNADSYIN